MANFAIIPVLIGQHGFLMMILALPISYVVTQLFKRWTGRSSAWAWLIYPLAFVDIFLGPNLARWVLYRCGTTGAATVTGSYATSDQYNNQNVTGYNVLIRTAAGRVVKTDFEDDDFNVYPSPWNSAVYPGPGDDFNVRYLPMFPGNFVIVANDGSPWAEQNRCRDINAAGSAAESAYDFDKTDHADRAAFIDALQSVLATKCYDGEDDRAADQQELDTLRAGGDLSQ